MYIIRHSRLPAGNALWFCQNFLFFFFFCRQGFRMITFDRQAGPLQNLNRSQVIGRSVLLSDPAQPAGGGVGRPKHPKIRPPLEKKNVCMRFRTPGTFLKKKCSREKKRRHFSPPPPPPKKNFHHPPPSPQNTPLNPGAIISTPTIAV